MPTFKPHNPRAFSLVELLVVIAIVALLISLLLPALGSARESARAVGCLSNTRQLGLATAAYANDFRDFVAREGGWIATPGALQTRVPWAVAYRPYLDPRAEHDRPINDRFAISPYYRCPSRAERTHPIHYLSNGFSFDAAGEPIPHRPRGLAPLTIIDNPAHVFNIAELSRDRDDLLWLRWQTHTASDSDLAQFYDSWSRQHLTLGSPEPRLGSDRHSSACNILRFDGHAGRVASKAASKLEPWNDGAPPPP